MSTDDYDKLYSFLNGRGFDHKMIKYVMNVTKMNVKKLFIDYFTDKGHTEIQSSSLIQKMINRYFLLILEWFNSKIFF